MIHVIGWFLIWHHQKNTKSPNFNSTKISTYTVCIFNSIGMQLPSRCLFTRNLNILWTDKKASFARTCLITCWLWVDYNFIKFSTNLNIWFFTVFSKGSYVHCYYSIISVINPLKRKLITNKLTVHYLKTRHWKLNYCNNYYNYIAINTWW